MRAVAALANFTSSPGVPWVELAKDKGLVFKEHLPLLQREVINRLNLLCSVDLTTHPEASDPVWLVKNGFCDPVRLFVKNEPHTIEKIEEGRVRLISSVSYTDEVVERLLFETQNNREIDSWLECPSKPGLGLAKDEQAQALHASLSKHLDEAAESDVSGWDWCVKDWMLAVDAETRVRLARGAGALYARLVHNRMWCLAHSVFALSDGRLIAQMRPGIMKSGSYVTSSTNSRMRVALALLSGAKWAIAMGDDCIEQWHEGAAAAYARWGIKVKVFQRVTERSFEFCSHKFTPGGLAIFLNMNKAVFRLLSHAPDSDRLAQFVEITRHSPEQPQYLAAIDQVWRDLTIVSIDTHCLDSEDMARRRRSARARKNARQNQVQRPRLKGRGDYELVPYAGGNQLDRIEKKVDAIRGKTNGIGAGIGRALGSAFGQGDLGATLGGAAARMIGMGDYKPVTVNSLIKGLPGSDERSTSIPEMVNGKRGVIYREKEYLGDIVSSSTAGAFKNQVFRFNPADPATFPWLSGMAPYFDQWEPRGAIVHFVSTSATFSGTGQQLGVVILAANYDPQDEPYVNKVEMEAADYAISAKSADNIAMGLECNPNERATRLLFTSPIKASSPAEQRMNDLCTIEVASQGAGASQTLGELWVEYEIAFYKKQLRDQSLGSGTLMWSVGSETVVAGVWSANYPLGVPGYAAIKYASENDFKMTLVQPGAGVVQCFFPPQITKGCFLIEGYWQAATGVTLTSSSSFDNASAVNCEVIDFGATRTITETSTNGVATPRVMQSIAVKVTGPNASYSTAAIALSGTAERFCYTVTQVGDLPLTTYTP